VLWYGLHSFLAAWVYDPVGVRPRELGLTSGAVFTQTTSGLIALLLIVVIVIAFFVLWGLWRSADRSIRRGKDVGEIIAGVVSWVILGVFAAILALVLIVLFSAWNARDSIQKGERPNFVWGLLPSPWPAQVASIRGVKGTEATLPKCALYLGQADGTAVLVHSSDGDETTLRVPASSIVLVLRPEDQSCPSRSSAEEK